MAAPSVVCRCQPPPAKSGPGRKTMSSVATVGVGATQLPRGMVVVIVVIVAGIPRHPSHCSSIATTTVDGCCHVP